MYRCVSASAANVLPVAVPSDRLKGYARPCAAARANAHVSIFLSTTWTHTYYGKKRDPLKEGRSREERTEKLSRNNIASIYVDPKT
eukprot:1724425-Prymnesium_polylepis.1